VEAGRKHSLSCGVPLTRFKESGEDLLQAYGLVQVVIIDREASIK
jgi:hypothetical protein